jgi:hypothetical protein
MRSHLEMRSLTNKGTKGRKAGRNVYRGCHQEELPSNFCINQTIGRCEPGRPRKNGFIFEDGTGHEAPPL